MDILSNIVDIFWSWTTRKIEHHLQENNKRIFFHEKEIWWVALGKNIGYEIDGKHTLFERPALIIKKYSKDMCFVLPLTTKIKQPIPNYLYPLHDETKEGAVNLSQGRTISSKRLLRKKGKIDDPLFTKIITRFSGQFK